MIEAHTEPQVAQLADRPHVASLAECSQSAHGPVAVTLQVTEQPHDHAQPRCWSSQPATVRTSGSAAVNCACRQKPWT